MSGPFLASVSRDKNVLLYNAGTGQLIHRFEGHNNWVRDVVFHPGGRYLLTASDDKVRRNMTEKGEKDWAGLESRIACLLSPMSHRAFSFHVRPSASGTLRTSEGTRRSMLMVTLWRRSVGVAACCISSPFRGLFSVFFLAHTHTFSSPIQKLQTWPNRRRTLSVAAWTSLPRSGRAARQVRSRPPICFPHAP